jgi:RNA polymerase sigma-70 factor (ECF subfamily)
MAEAAFDGNGGVAELYERYHSFVARRLRSLGVPESLVEDAGQDVYLVAFRRIGDFRGEAHVKTWLSAIAQHVASNYRRSERRRSARIADGSLDEMEPFGASGINPAADPLEWTARREAATLLDKLLCAIGDRTRNLFVLVSVEGMTVGEAARVLGMNANTAYTRLRAARPACTEAMVRSASLVL